MFRFAVILLIGTTYVDGLYTSSDDVVELTASNFNKKVINSDELWLVEFYAPWCGHCKNLAPEWKKAASNLKGIVNVGAVDMDQHQSVGQPYSIQGFPTIKIFGYDKNKPKDYSGGRNADSITDAGMKALKDMVQERQRGGKKSGGSSGGDSGSRGGGGGGSDDVVTLTDSNFRELVLDSDETWFVEFYAPWCGHCKNLAPHWASAATEVKEKTDGAVKLGALDATVHQATGGKYGIRGYPTIKIFRRGFKNEPIDYDGSRDSSGIVNKAMEYFEENIEPPTVDELVKEDVLEKNCASHLCIISFLPDLMDTGKDGRNNYLELLTKLGDKFKKQKWGWMWAPALAQPELEKALQVGGFGYPAVVAMNKRKEVYALYRGAFSDDGMGTFLNVLTYGRGKLNTYPLTDGKLPAVITREPWDGKDAPPVEVEDIDLSDFKWDDEL